MKQLTYNMYLRMPTYKYHQLRNLSENIRFARQGKLSDKNSTKKSVELITHIKI